MCKEAPTTLFNLADCTSLWLCTWLLREVRKLRKKTWGRRKEDDKAEEEKGEAERTNLPPPRWHRWIYAGRTAEALRDLSGCNFSSAAASDHRLPGQVLNKASDQLKKSIWSLKTSNHRIIVLFLDPKFRAWMLHLDRSSDNNSAEPLDALVNPGHCCVCALKVHRSSVICDTCFVYVYLK